MYSLGICFAKTEAAMIGEALVKNWIYQLQVPLNLHADQNRNFESTLLQDMCKIPGLKKTRMTHLHLQSNGIVER